MRPGDPAAPVAGRACGGAAIWGAPSVGPPPPGAVRCAVTASCGAGATTALGARLRSPT